MRYEGWGRRAGPRTVGDQRQG